MTMRTLREYLHDPAGDGVAAPRDLAVLIEAISDSCRTIGYLVSRGALAGVLAPATCRARSRSSSTSSPTTR